MRVVIDLDGTICTLKKENQSYRDVTLIEGADNFIKNLRKQGCYVIIQTARNMATCEGNLGKVMSNVGKITLDWLEKNKIEYDEIYFGKPNGNIYIDDRAFRFNNNWKDLNFEVLKKISKEK